MRVINGLWSLSWKQILVWMFIKFCFCFNLKLCLRKVKTTGIFIFPVHVLSISYCLIQLLPWVKKPLNTPTQKEATWSFSLFQSLSSGSGVKRLELSPESSKLSKVSMDQGGAADVLSIPYPSIWCLKCWLLSFPLKEWRHCIMKMFHSSPF